MYLQLGNLYKSRRGINTVSQKSSEESVTNAILVLKPILEEDNFSNLSSSMASKKQVSTSIPNTQHDLQCETSLCKDECSQCSSMSLASISGVALPRVHFLALHLSFAGRTELILLSTRTVFGSPKSCLRIARARDQCKASVVTSIILLRAHHRPHHYHQPPRLHGSS